MILFLDYLLKFIKNTQHNSIYNWKYLTFDGIDKRLRA